MHLRFFISACLLTWLSPLTSANEAKKLTPEFIKEFEAYAEQARVAWQVPGMAIGIVHENEIILAKGYGVKELGGSERVNENTLFEIGSISKSFTSTLTAMLVDESKFEWDDKVIDYFPDFVMHDPWVTRAFQIQDLYSQRSGLAPHAGDEQIYFGAGRLEMIHNLRLIPPVSSFRSSFAYQNSFFLVGGEICHSVTGSSWEELMKERIFDPLGMKNSSTSLKSFLANKNTSQPHFRLKGQTKKLPDDYPFKNAYTLFGPAGGINSTINDMNQYLRFLLAKGNANGTPLVTAKTMEQTYRRYIYGGVFFDSDIYYGLGWCIREYSPHSIIWHDGTTAGFTSMLGFIPQEQLGIVVLSNVAGADLSRAIIMQFFDYYYQKKEAKDWSQTFLESKIQQERTLKEKSMKPKNPEPALSLEKYAGVYESKIYGRVEVRQENNQLQILLGKNKSPLPLEHWNHDSFLLVWPALQSDENITVTFGVGDEGEANCLALSFLTDGINTFEKL